MLIGQVAKRLGEPDGVIAFDLSSFPKRGRHSVGEAPVVWPPGQGRQLPGRGLHGVRLPRDHALLDFRLSLPQEWAWDAQRRQACHVPPEVQYQTRQAQCLEMLDIGGQVPHGWVTGDDELGRHTGFRHVTPRAG